MHRFLLAQLHLESLIEIDKPSVKAVRSALGKLPSGSDAYNHAYETAMERIEKQVPGHRDFAKRILSWITCAKRPLTTVELRHALAVEVGTVELDEDALPEIEDMVAVCTGLVTIDEQGDIIRLVHYTTQQYFDKNREKWFPNAEADVTTTCITYLSFDVFESGFCPTDQEFEERLRLHSLYHYAAHYWGDHARRATNLCEGVLDFLESGLKLESSIQALMATKLAPMQSDYSQNVPKQMAGLHLAAYFGAMRETQILLYANIPDLKDSYGRTPASYASMNGRGAVLELLIERGAEVDSEDCEGRTPLSIAAAMGHEAVVWLLLRNGADIDLEDRHDQTPLSHASENGHEALVRLLLEEGAEADLEDCDRRTPLSFAAEMGYEAVVRLLLGNGAEADSKDCLGRTPLCYASENGHRTTVHLLLENGAEVDPKCCYGQTPLSFAAEGGYLAIVQLLVNNGARVDSKDSGRYRTGQTPLSVAARQGHIAVVQLLLENGAEACSKDNRGRTPLTYAIDYGHEDIAQLLLKKHSPQTLDNAPPIPSSEGTAQQRSVQASFSTYDISIPSKTSYRKRPNPDADTLSPDIPSKSSRH